LTRLPSLFVSHGAPLFALEPGSSGPALRQWGEALLKQGTLRGIVIMSPHWMARSPTVMANPQPETWHDFGGFPAALYQLQYPAPGSVGIAQEVQDLLAHAGIVAQPDAKRPLDHGAWVPLMHLFPQANVPVVQVALPAGYGPQEVFAMGRALHTLGERGILLVGSGSMTHNLAEFGGAAAAPMSYVTEFSRWVEAAVVRGDRAALLDYRTLAPHATRAHPTDDHFLPLFFALGASGWGDQPPVEVHYLSREVMYGMLAMDTFALG
jgi:4,5-DOPA dioxygenase extradiol